MTETVFTELAKQIPFTVLVVLVIAGAARYVDRWIGRVTLEQAESVTRRQTELLVLFEKLNAANAAAENRMSGVLKQNTDVISRNCEVIASTGATLSELCKTLAVMTESQQQMMMRVTTIEETLHNHAVDVASRPCMLPRGDRNRDRDRDPDRDRVRS